jgi:hypothetical protein
MFGPMKEALRGKRFSSDEEVVGAVQKTFSSDGIKKSVTRLNRCVEVEGEYVKKQY